MKICYIILTCKKFLETRAKWQRETCLSTVSLADCYFLSCEPGENSVYGWGTIDTYEGCPLKYIEFFKNMDLEYDFYVFMDDDTFVFPDRLYSGLEKIDKTQSLYIGCVLGHLSNLEFMSGGAGFILTNKAYKLVKQYIRTNDMTEVQKHRVEMLHGDVSMGQWIHNINKEAPQIELKRNIIPLSTHPHKTRRDLLTYATFHYLKEESQFHFYNTLINSSHLL
jgi:hypothetical protein